MRKFVLIAAMVLTTAAAAQAGGSRSLSRQNPGDPPAATTQPRTNDARADNTTTSTPAPAETPRYAPPAGEPAPPADATRNTSDTPHYTARPAAVDAATPPSSERTYHRSSRYRHAQMYRQAQMQRRPHRGRMTVGRIVAALHRYGIYW
jgi:hypothetical protein